MYYFISIPFVRANTVRAFDVLPCVLLAGVWKNICAFLFCTLYTLAFSVFEACMAFFLKFFIFILLLYIIILLFCYIFLFYLLLHFNCQNDQDSNTLKISFLSVSETCNSCRCAASMISFFSES